jgi:hypothetical protein
MTWKKRLLLLEQPGVEKQPDAHGCLILGTVVSYANDFKDSFSPPLLYLKKGDM